LLEPLEQEPSLTAALNALRRSFFLSAHLKVERCGFVIHTPTFITQYCSRPVTSVASVWFVVSVLPHRLLLSVAWVIAEGAPEEGSRRQISRKDSTRPNLKVLMC